MFCVLLIYRIVGNFDGFDVFQPDHQNLTCQILKAIQCLVKDTDHPSKYLKSKLASVKISPVKISRYTVTSLCCPVFPVCHIKA